jgi:hypothetical protein
MKKFTTVVLLALLSMSSHAQGDHSITPVNSTTPGLTDLVEKADDMTGNILYSDPRTNLHNLRGSGMFATILKTGGDYRLFLTVYHSLNNQIGEATSFTPIQVTGIIIKTTDTLFTFNNAKLIQGNGSALTEMRIVGQNADKDNFVYKILSRVIANDYCKLRFESVPGIPDYELSNREIKEIRAVVKDWLAVNKIQ